MLFRSLYTISTLGHNLILTDVSLIIGDCLHVYRKHGGTQWWAGHGVHRVQRQQARPLLVQAALQPLILLGAVHIALTAGVEWSLLCMGRTLQQVAKKKAWVWAGLDARLFVTFASTLVGVLTM